MQEWHHSDWNYIILLLYLLHVLILLFLHFIHVLVLVLVVVVVVVLPLLLMDTGVGSLISNPLLPARSSCETLIVWEIRRLPFLSVYRIRRRNHWRARVGVVLQ